MLRSPRPSFMRSLCEVGQLLAIPCNKEQLISSFQCDSRLIRKGDLFFALKGAKTDGHDFLEDVAKSGAIAAVVSEQYSGCDFGLTLFRMSNVLTAMHTLAHHVYKSSRAKVIAITGSLGKSTTKEFIATMLEAKFRIVKTLGNVNSQTGVPLTLLNAEETPELFVLEMGMSQKGEMRRLVDIAPPSIAVITYIAPAHVAAFPEGLDGIAAEKAEILGSSCTKLGVIHESASHFPTVVEKKTTLWTYGSKEENRFRIEELPQEQTWRIWEGDVPTPPFSLAGLPSHYAHNVLGAAIVARAMAFSWEEIFARLPFLQTLPKRFERIEREGVLFINDAYNANSVSVRAALAHLPPTSGKKIAVLGSMPELGRYSKACHEEVARVARECVDILLCLGEECTPMVALFHERQKPVEIFFDLSSLKKRVFALAKSGDVVLIKGGNVHKLWEILA